MWRKIDFVWRFAGCIVFMFIGLLCWYVLHTLVGFDNPYFIIAMINFISYTGYGMTNWFIRKYVWKLSIGCVECGDVR